MDSNSRSIRLLRCLETPTAFLEAVPSAWTVTRESACKSRSIRVLGCFETPTAFLDAVPSAWTVTRGVPVTRGLYGLYDASKRQRVVSVYVAS
jgi:hypothetical protein